MCVSDVGRRVGARAGELCESDAAPQPPLPPQLAASRISTSRASRPNNRPDRRVRSDWNIRMPVNMVGISGFPSTRRAYAGLGTRHRSPRAGLDTRPVLGPEDRRETLQQIRCLFLQLEGVEKTRTPRAVSPRRSCVSSSVAQTSAALRTIVFAIAGR